MKAIGVIGGSGLYEIGGLTDVREVRVETPFGPPSDALVRGRLGDAELIFLPRHGRGHRLNPSEVPYRANLWALKSLGAGWVISVSAVGSLREDIEPGQVVLVDQFIDRTFGRASTFFEKGVVAHVPFGDPVCGALRGILRDAARDADVAVHDGGTYVCIEGPAFSSRAESELYRSWGASVVGMTNVPEAKLAREAELSYATLAMVTDFDCWHPAHDQVSVEAVIATFGANVSRARELIARSAPRIAAHDGPPPCSTALAGAIITDLASLDPERVRALAPILARVLG